MSYKNFLYTPFIVSSDHSHIFFYFSITARKMESLDVQKLLSFLSTCKKDYKARYNSDKLANNVANFGANAKTILVHNRNGEYAGIKVQVLDDVKPLLTDERISRTLKHIDQQQYDLAMTAMLTTSVDEMLYILDKWFTNATTSYDNSIDVDNAYKQHDEWIKQGIHSAVRSRMVVIAGGDILGDSSHITFSSGDDLHRHMTAIRGGRGPPVTYAITYSMLIQNEKKIYTADELIGANVNKIFYIDSGIIVDEPEDKEKFTYILLDKLCIGHCNVIVQEDEKYHKESVGLLVSRLQKCIRYGPEVSHLLLETIDKLVRASVYNLPENKYEKVSACRQLAWRGFISIVEDVGPVSGVLDLLLLAIIAQECDGVFSPSVISHIKSILLFSLYVDNAYNWRQWNGIENVDLDDIHGENEVTIASIIALLHMPMMRADKWMLGKYIVGNPMSLRTLPQSLPSHKQGVSMQQVTDDIMIRSVDHHCRPNISILYQACQEVNKYALHEVCGLIWNNSSSYNYRKGAKYTKLVHDDDLYSLQQFILNNKLEVRDYDQYKEKEEVLHISPLESRNCFISLFGQTYRYGKGRICYNGDTEYPLRILKNGKWEYEKAIVDVEKTIVNTSTLPCPSHLEWRKKRYTVNIDKGKPYVDGVEIPWFDASSLLREVAVDRNGDDEITQCAVETILSTNPVPWNVYQSLMTYSSEPCDWIKYATSIYTPLVRYLYMKIVNREDNVITVGPVDRHGKATTQAVDEKLEGRVWGALQLMCYIYPTILKMRKNFITFEVTRGEGLHHMLTSLEKLVCSTEQTREVEMKSVEHNTPQSSHPSIMTPLWEHQDNSVRRILTAFASGRKGMGDSSDVGAGKTLVALSVASELIKNTRGVGILVLVPSHTLIKTWKDEINKHTRGYNVITQAANGVLSSSITRNSIVISTMGRMRDHPVENNWILLIIDECLSVQNAKALQTAEAWRQSMFSSHILMLSATFFRSRHDKLYYMLKMLRSGIPEIKEYLDALLLETMVSQQNVGDREWTVEVEHIIASEEFMKEHGIIIQSSLTDEAKYAKANSLCVNYDIVDELAKILKSDKKHLIYARSKKEAERWSEVLNIPIYPDISTNNVIATFATAAMGVNDLVKYDTIVMHPPPPDLLPQIKGRLARNGQKMNKLSIVYILLKDTIEEGLLRRLDIASQFSTNYIMPLSRFYQVSLEGL